MAQVGVEGELLESLRGNETVLVVVSSGEHVTRSVGTAVEAQVVVLQECVVAEQQVFPVGIGIGIGAPRGTISKRSITARILIHGIYKVDEVLSLHDVQFASRHLRTHGGVEGEVLRTHLARLGGDHHHAVGTARTVDGRGRGVLEHLHRLDVGGVDVADVAAHQGESVDDVERLVAGVDGTRAADADGWSLARLVVVEHGHTGGLALQRLEGVARHVGHDGLRLHVGGSSRQVRLLHRTVADDHHLLQVGAVLLQGHVKAAAAHLDLLALVADVRENEGSAARHADLELAVKIGHCSHAGVVLHNHAHADQRLARVVLYHTADACLLLNGGRLRNALAGAAAGVPARGNGQHGCQCQTNE